MSSSYLLRVQYSYKYSILAVIYSRYYHSTVQYSYSYDLPDSTSAVRVRITYGNTRTSTRTIHSSYLYSTYGISMSMHCTSSVLHVCTVTRILSIPRCYLNFSLFNPRASVGPIPDSLSLIPHSFILILGVYNRVSIRNKEDFWGVTSIMLVARPINLGCTKDVHFVRNKARGVPYITLIIREM